MEPKYRYNENEIYDELVSQLFKTAFHQADHFELVFARRGKKNRSAALRLALQKAQQTGAGWMLGWINWQGLEPTEGHFAWNDGTGNDLDNVIRAGQSANLRVHACSHSRELSHCGAVNERPISQNAHVRVSTSSGPMAFPVFRAQ